MFNKTLWDLYRKYPQFIEEDSRNNYTRFGLAIGKGWTPIIRNLFEALEQIGFDGKILQVKEKFAYLRVYLAPGSWGISAFISQAEWESGLCCENCGLTTWMRWDEDVGYRRSPYVRHDLSWELTLCGYCYMTRKVFRLPIGRFHGRMFMRWSN